MKWLKLSEKIPVIASIIAIGVGSGVLFSWYTGFNPFLGFYPFLTPMNPVTAVGLILAGVCLGIRAEVKGHKLSEKLTAALSLALIFIAANKLIDCFGFKVPIDQVLFSKKLDLEPGATNRMAPNAALCFLFVGYSLFFLGKKTKKNNFLSDYLTLPPLIIASIGLMGYFYSNMALTRIRDHTPIAFHTALTFLILCLGILFAPGESGIIGVFKKKSAGATMGRKMLPCTLYIPIALGWVIIQMQRLDFFDAEFGVMILAVAGAIIGTAVLWFNTSVVGRLEDALERKAKADMEIKMNRLKRFFPPSISDMIASGEIDDPFKWHRNDITVIFIDIRGFTSFAELAEPEEVMKTLQEYYSSIGKIAQKHGGSIGHVAGDGVMIFFNDPVPVPYPQKSAVIMALEIRDAMSHLCAKWQTNDLCLHFGAGIASGYTTIGGMGSEGFWDYTVVGTTTNMASRLCSVATEGQILVPKVFLNAVSDEIKAEPVGSLNFKGIHQAVSAYNILGVK